MFCSILSRITFSSRLKWFFQWKIFTISWKWRGNGVEYFQICTYLHEVLSHRKLCRKFNQNLLNLSQSFFLPLSSSKFLLPSSSSKVHICQRKHVENQSTAGFFGVLYYHFLRKFCTLTWFSFVCLFVFNELTKLKFKTFASFLLKYGEGIKFGWCHISDCIDFHTMAQPFM